MAFMAPTAAMWIATTFGTASTGAAISTLSGAAATNAALAWLGGGALAAGGGGMAGGTAFLALAGPVGWSIAGATLLSSILIFTAKKTKLNNQKNEEIHKKAASLKKIPQKVGNAPQVGTLFSDYFVRGVRRNGFDMLTCSCKKMVIKKLVLFPKRAFCGIFPTFWWR